MCFVCPQPFCRATEPICGHNGETYSSVCAAYSDRVAVDYHGPCQAVGVLSEYSSIAECAAVKCLSLSVTECKPIIPPGRLAVSEVGQGWDGWDLLVHFQRVSYWGEESWLVYLSFSKSLNSTWCWLDALLYVDLKKLWITLDIIWSAGFKTMCPIFSSKISHQTVTNVNR